MYTYIATNTLNGKFYIGSSINFEERKKSHLTSKEKYPFQNALRKNPKAFEWQVWRDDSDGRELEQALLDMWYGKEQCYNLNPDASAPPVYEWTDERRKTAGERAKRRGVECLHTPQAIAKAKETRRNNPTVLTDEMRATRSKNLIGNTRKRGKKESQETRARKSKAHTGKSKLEHKEKMLGRTWWVHPSGERKFQVESPGAEWENRYPGRTTKGRKHWVNAEGKRKLQNESPGPGWQNGQKWRDG
jgi:group I intron endonuclease